MAIPSSLLNLLSHPAPGLVFAAHERASLPERAYGAPHVCRPPATRSSVAAARRALGPAGDHYVALCAVHNGFTLCADPGGGSDGPGLLTFAPLDEVEELRSLFDDRSGPLGWLIEGAELFDAVRWIPIVAVGQGSIWLALCLDGVHRGEPVAGTVRYIAGDPLMEVGGRVADSVCAMLDEIGGDPAAFANRLGYCGTAVDAAGARYGDELTGYVPDVRSHPRLSPRAG